MVLVVREFIRTRDPLIRDPDPLNKYTHSNHTKNCIVIFTLKKIFNAYPLNIAFLCVALVTVVFYCLIFFILSLLCSKFTLSGCYKHFNILEVRIWLGGACQNRTCGHKLHPPHDISL